MIVLSFSGRIERRHVVTLAATCLGLASAPFLLSAYPLGLLTLGLAYGLFAFGLDLAWGRAGVVSIGNAAFFGLGAYGLAIANERGVPMAVGALAGIVCAVVLAAVVGFIGLSERAVPSTMAMLTLALTLGVAQIATSWLSVTNGTNGLLVPFVGVVEGYYTTALVAVGTVAVVWFAVLRGRVGRHFLAVRVNEQRAAHLGIDPRRTRLVAFILSAAVSALAGAIAAPQIGLVSPGTAGIVLSAEVLVWLAVGGRGTIAGAFGGAVAVTMGQQYLGDALGSWFLLTMGGIFVLIVLFAPAGLVGVAQTLLRRPLHQTSAQGAVLDVYAVPRRRRAGADAASDANALELRGVRKAFGSISVIEGVDMNVPVGEVICLIGPNGAGKTTLLGIIAGDVSPDEGVVHLLGTDVTDWPAYRRARAGLGRLFQLPSLFLEQTPAQNLALARSEALRTVELPPQYVRFEHDDSTLARELSLADRRALEIAVVLAWGPKIVLLDEPAAGLAHEDSIQLANTLRATSKALGCTLLIVEHDMDIVREMAERVVVLANGRILVGGTMEDVSSHPEVRQAYLGDSSHA